MVGSSDQYTGGHASQSLSGLNEVATIQNSGNNTINSQTVRSVYRITLSKFCF